MLVKIHDNDNNTKMDRKDAYKAPNGFYYSSEEAYKQAVNREKLRKQCIDKMYEYMGYQSFMKLPTIFYKRLKEWEGYGYQVIYRAMLLADTGIQKALASKDFDNELNKTTYLSAIIQNQLNDALKREKHEQAVESDAPKIEIDNISNIGHKAKPATGVADLLGGF